MSRALLAALLLLLPALATAQIAVTGTKNQDGDQNNSLTIGTPSGLAAGDTWIMVICQDADPGGTINTPGGWSVVGSQFEGGGDGWPLVKILWKIASAGDVSAGSATVTITGTDYLANYFTIRVTGAHATAPISVTGTPNTPATAGLSDVDAPDVTVPDNSSVAILVGGAEGDGANLTEPNTTTLLDKWVSAFPLCAVAYKAVNAGSFAPGDWSLGADTDNDLFAQTFAIAPNTGGGLPPDNSQRLLLLGVGDDD